MEPIAQPPRPLKQGLRAEWGLNPDITFLNHGSFGAAPTRVLKAQDQWRRRLEADPIELLGRRSPELLATARAGVGSFLGMGKDDFGFVTNTTEGVNAVLQSLDLRPGDELLTTNHVYHAVRQAMRAVAARSGASVREVKLPLPVPSLEAIVDAVMSAVSPPTRVLVIDHVTSPTALRFPVERIVTACAARGVSVLVDGAHAPGMLDLDVPAIGAAWYTGNLHKWVCAPKGSAFLSAQERLRDRLHPAVISHYFGEGFRQEFDWQGTRDISAWLTTPAAIAFLAELGWSEVRAHNHAMAVWAQQYLCGKWGVEPISPLDGSLLGSMCTVPLPPPLDRLSVDEGKALQQRLYTEHQVEVPIVRFGERTYVRPCWQVYNTSSEAERLAEVVSTLSRAG